MSFALSTVCILVRLLPIDAVVLSVFMRAFRGWEGKHWARASLWSRAVGYQSVHKPIRHCLEAGLARGPLHLHPGGVQPVHPLVKLEGD